MISSLAQQQAALVDALWQGRQADAVEALAAYRPDAGTHARAVWERGLRAYRSNGVVLAERVLAAAFPVVTRLLGPDNFAPLAHRFWRTQPPVRGDLAQWGEAWPPFLAAVPGLAQHEPYLIDVARVEWALHAAAGAVDGLADAASLRLLAQRDPGEVFLRLAPGTCTVASRYPVVAMVLSHLGGEPPPPEADHAMQAGVAQTALVWRDGLRPRLRLALPGEAPFLAALQENRSLLDSMAAAPDVDFGGWLTPAVQHGLLLAAGTSSFHPEPS